MPDEDMLNTQIKDSVQYANHTVMGHAPSQSASMLDALMAETIGMAMYNAVNTQHNAQMISTAAVAATCAKMLKTQPVPWLPPPVPIAPVISTVTVTSVTVVSDQTNTFKVAGTGFASGLTVDVLSDGKQVGTITGTAITNVLPVSFTMQSALLTAGATFSIQVVNTDQGESAPFSFTVPA
jgi:hypothetical protein